MRSRRVLDRSTIYAGTPTRRRHQRRRHDYRRRARRTDLIYGSNGTDVIVAPGAANTVCGGASESTKAGFSIITATAGAGNLIVGGAGSDIIEGGSGGNTIVGGGGNNLLIGGSGANVVYGRHLTPTFDNPTALLLFGTPPTSPSGRDVIFSKRRGPRVVATKCGSEVRSAGARVAGQYVVEHCRPPPRRRQRYGLRGG